MQAATRDWFDFDCQNAIFHVLWSHLGGIIVHYEIEEGARFGVCFG